MAEEIKKIVYLSVPCVDLSEYHPEKGLQLEWVDGTQAAADIIESVKMRIDALQYECELEKNSLIYKKLSDNGWSRKQFARTVFAHYPERKNFSVFCNKHIYPFLKTGKGKGEVFELCQKLLGISLDYIDDEYQRKIDRCFIEIKHIIKHIKLTDELFFKRFQMIWYYREGICNNPELANIRVDNCGYFVGCDCYARLGQLLSLYQAGALRYPKKCRICGCEYLWFQTIGTPGSGYGISSGFCPECGSVSHESKSFAAGIHRDYLDYHSSCPVMDTKWTLLDLIFALEYKNKMKFTPRYLFDKYGKDVLVEWDHSYDEETDEDIEFTDNELFNIVRELIKLGADVNAVEEDGDTPIHHYIYHFDILKMLVEEYGADVKVLNTGSFIYDSLVFNNKLNTLKYLIEHGIDINRRDCNGWSILHCAVDHRRTDMVKMLLEHGADPNAQSKMGTPLHRWLDNADIARLLLEHGADPNSRDWDNWTPLCLCRDVETARVLMEHGADPNLDLGELRTPLVINSGYISEAMEEMGYYQKKQEEALSMYCRAVEIAQKCHQNQVDKVGVPIFNHVRNVASRCATNEQKTVAILHDTIEDGGMTADELRTAGFDETVVEAVVAITRNQGEDYFDYIRRCAQNPIARKVKMHDIEHNLEVIRFAQKCKPVADICTKEFRKHGPFVLNEEDLYRLNKYLMAYEMLRAIDDKEAFDNPGLKTCLASYDSTLEVE